MTYFFAIRMPEQNTLQKNHKYSDRIFLFSNVGFLYIFNKFHIRIKKYSLTGLTSDLYIWYNNPLNDNENGCLCPFGRSKAVFM